MREREKKKQSRCACSQPIHFSFSKGTVFMVLRYVIVIFVIRSIDLTLFGFRESLRGKLEGKASFQFQIRIARGS